jgi:serine/threonine protein kinase/WD40 repeat protein/tetratricopeptide (TPR) repeat protein
MATEGVAMSDRTSEHPALDELTAYHLGRLDEKACEAIEAHLLDCPHCCRRLGGLPSQPDPLLSRLRGLLESDTGHAAMGANSLTKTLAASEYPTVSQSWPSLPGYEILAELGRGGMGVVYKARQLRLGRVVALKMILSGAHASPAERVRLRREAAIVAQLRHPNLIQIYEIGEHEGRPYLALEYVDGGSLAARIRGQPQPPRDSAGLVETLARGVAAAHAQGIIHRDLKPANVLLLRKDEVRRMKDEESKDGSDSSFILHPSSFIPKITDFGLARSLDGERGLTASGAIVGTPEYMAPEQVVSAGAVLGPAADVYALGVILYEMLTGQPPFRAATVLETFQQAAEQEPVPPSRRVRGVGPDLDTICLKCLRKRPADRYVSALELADELVRFLRGEAIRARPVGVLEHAWKWACRKPALALLLLAVLLTLLAGSTASTYFGITARRRADDADRARETAQDLAMEKEQALQATRQAKHDSDLRAAQLKFNAGLEECQSGAVARGLFTLLDAWRLAPSDAHDLRRVIRLNVAAWQHHLPLLVETIRTPSSRRCGIRFLAPAGETFAVWNGNPCRIEWRDSASGRPVWAKPLILKGMVGLDINSDGTRLLARADRPGIQSAALYRLPEGDLVREGIGYRKPDGNLTTAEAFFTSGRGIVMTRQFDIYQADYNRRRFWSLGGTISELPLAVTVRDHEGLHLVADSGREVAVVFHSLDRLAGTVPVAEFWDLLTGQRLKSLQAPPGRLDPRLSWDGRTIVGVYGDGYRGVSYNGDGFVAWFDTATGRQVGPAWRPRRTARYLTLSADGQNLASWGSDQRVRVHDLSTGMQRGGDIATAGAEAAVAVAPDGSRLLTSNDGVVRLWRIPERSLQATVAASPRSPSPRRPRVNVYGAEFSRDSQVIVARSHGKQGLAWLVDATTGNPKGQPMRHPSLGPLAISPDKTRVATANDPSNHGGLLRLWDAQGQPLTPFIRNPALMHALSFSPNGRTLAVAGVRGVYLWGVDRLTMRHLFENTCAGDLLFSADGRRLAVGYKAGWGGLGAGFCLWDVTTGSRVGKEAVKIHAPWNRRLVMAFGSEARDQATANETLDVLRVFVPPTGAYYTMDASRGTLCGKPRALGPAEQAAFSSDGRLLATSSTSSRVRLFDSAGQQLEPSMSSPATVLGLCFSPDGTILAAHCRDGAVRLWDTATRLPLGPPLLHYSGVVAVQFSPSGRTLTSITETGVTTTWPLPGPVADDPDGVERQLEVMGGVGLRGDEVVPLDPAAWQEKKRQLASHGGPPVGETPADWHDRRARDADEDDNTFAVLWHLERLAKLRPNDWSVQARQGRALSNAGEWTRAESAYCLAASQAKDSVAALADWYRQRVARFRALEKWNESLWYLNRLAEVAAKDWRVYAERAEAFGALGKKAEREADLNRAIEHGADAEFLIGLADEKARQGKWARAVALFARAGTRGPLPVMAHYHRALACLKAGDEAGYRRLCGGLLKGLPAIGPGLDPFLAYRVARLCAVKPDAVSAWQPPLALIEHAHRWLNAVGHREIPAGQLPAIRSAWLGTHGRVLYRAGRYRDAVERLNQAIAVQGKGGTMHDWLFLALAHHGLKQPDEARKWRDKVSRHKAPPRDFWEEVEAELLCQEMARLLNESKAP